LSFQNVNCSNFHTNEKVQIVKTVLKLLKYNFWKSKYTSGWRRGILAIENFGTLTFLVSFFNVLLNLSILPVGGSYLCSV